MSLKLADPVKLDVNGVNEILDMAREREFNAVIIFGYKDDMVHVIKSGIKGTIEVIGALEAAKQNLWGG